MTTLKEWSENKEARKQLEKALQMPGVQMALDLIEQENMPSLLMNSTMPGLDAREMIALDTAAKAGAQSVLRKLRSLPYLISAKDRQSILGEPWAHLADPRDIEIYRKQQEQQKTRKTS